MKKYIVYVALVAGGLLAGYLLFGRADGVNKVDEHEHSAADAGNEMWTCSMHPQIMANEPGDCPICGMDLIPAEVSAEGLSADQFKLTENAMALANISTYIIGEDQASKAELALSGKIMANEETNAVQTAHFSGRVENLNVNFTGEEIRKGQLLGRIYSPELVAAQQELLTAMSIKESQPLLYAAVKKKLSLWKLSDKQIAGIEASGKVIENFPVYANVSGIVTDKMISEGDYVKQGQALFKISNLSTVWAEFDVYENQISFLKMGQQIRVKTNAFPNEQFEAKISFINPVLNTKTRIVVVRAVLANGNNKFKPGMFVEGVVSQLENASSNIITVPKTAVMWTGKRSIVYIKTSKDAPVFEMRQVSLGAAIQDKYEIIEGLQAGDEIVTNGTFTVDAAAQLQGKKSMMNSAGGRTTTGHEGHSGMETMASADNVAMNMSFNTAFESQFSPVISNYLGLKDALITSDAAKVAAAANKTVQDLKKLNVSSLGAMEKQHISIIDKKLNEIAKATDIKLQRDSFIVLSNNMISVMEEFKSVKNSLYVQFCPMANGNKGAFWLSSEEAVQNPYYGEMMLTCGEVKRVIK
jgi:Cu(I)/Ag(I) efflux system membrane fusion protein